MANNNADRASNQSSSYHFHTDRFDLANLGAQFFLRNRLHIPYSAGDLLFDGLSFVATESLPEDHPLQTGIKGASTGTTIGLAARLAGLGARVTTPSTIIGFLSGMFYDAAEREWADREMDNSPIKNDMISLIQENNRLSERADFYKDQITIDSSALDYLKSTLWPKQRELRDIIAARAGIGSYAFDANDTIGGDYATNYYRNLYNQPLPDILRGQSFFYPSVTDEPTPLLDYWANNRPVSVVAPSQPRTPAPRLISLPSRDPDSPDMSGFPVPDYYEPPAAYQYPNDNIDGWDIANFSHPAIDAGAATRAENYAAIQSDWDAINQNYEANRPLTWKEGINTAGSAINTAYNVMSFGSTLQDVLTGRRSDPGAYLSLANSSIQGLSWLSKTDGAKEIVSAIGDLQDPLDTMAGVTGGAVAGWGLYQNIAGLANGEVNAQNVLGVAANAGQLYQTPAKPLPARALALAA